MHLVVLECYYVLTYIKSFHEAHSFVEYDKYTQVFETTTLFDVIG